MSVKALNWAFDCPYEPNLKILLLTLADQANDEGYCWPSQETLARRASLGERTVRRHVAELVARGLLTVERRSTPSGRRSNMYRLNIGADFPLETQQPAKLAGWGEPVDNVPVDNLCEEGLSVANTATGQIGRLVPGEGTQPATSGRSQPATGGRLQYRKNHHKNHQSCPVGNSSSPARGLAESDRTGGVPQVDAPAVSLSSTGAAALAPVFDPGPEPVPELELVPETVAEPEPALRPERELAPEPAPAARPGGASGQAPAVSREDLALIARCLPESLQAINRDGIAQVVAALKTRLEAGWKSYEIRENMGGYMPEKVFKMSAFVIGRLEANVDPALAPVRLQRLSDKQLEERRNRRLEQITNQAEPELDPLTQQLLDQGYHGPALTQRILEIKAQQQAENHASGHAYGRHAKPEATRVGGELA